MPRASVPCGEAQIVIERPRYQSSTETINARPGAPATVTAHLSRPTVPLELSSVPEGATFKVNGNPVGRAPITIDVPRYEHIKVEATAPGRAPWKQKLYIKKPGEKITATLGN
jgi:hypothetical protein